MVREIVSTLMFPEIMSSHNIYILLRETHSLSDIARLRGSHFKEFPVILRAFSLYLVRSRAPLSREYTAHIYRVTASVQRGSAFRD